MDKNIDLNLNILAAEEVLRRRNVIQDLMAKIKHLEVKVKIEKNVTFFLVTRKLKENY